MIDVLGPEKPDGVPHRKRSQLFSRALNRGDGLPRCPATWCSSQPVISLAKQYQEGSLTAVAAGEQVVPALNLLPP